VWCWFNRQEAGCLTGAVSSLKTRAPLQTRIGIATGIVVVGDLMRSGNAQERGIVGETTSPVHETGQAQPDAERKGLIRVAVACLVSCDKY
jgi:hypothetical protein